MLFVRDQTILGLSSMDCSLLVGGFYFIATLSVGLISCDPGELVVMAPVAGVLAFLIWPAILFATAVVTLSLVVVLIVWTAKAIFAASQSPPMAE